MRYRVVKQKYTDARKSPADKNGVMGEKESDGARAATEAVNELTEGWLHTADEVMIMMQITRDKYGGVAAYRKSGNSDNNNDR